MRLSISKTSCLGAIALYLNLATAETIAQINGNKFLSPYQNKDVTNVTGLVTAKGPNGFWIRSTTPDNDPTTSESIYVFNSTVARTLATGDVVSLGGRVTEYRSSSTYLYLTQISKPVNVKVLSHNNTFKPVVLGSSASTSPPTEQFTSLDDGDVYGLPNNVSRLSGSNPVLQPTKYGLDFWESLSGELVTVQKARAISKASSYGNTWVVGSWNTTGGNTRGGLTMTAKDSNPEAIIIGDPLDGTNNPNSTKLGDSLEDITGVVTYAFGYYTILPLTAIKITGSQSPAMPPKTTLTSSGTCSGLTIGDYNIENFAPNSTNNPHIQIADHIANYLKNPDIVFLQEIQDNSGPTDDGTVNSNETLTTITTAIKSFGGITYSFLTIDPINDQNGGQPGGNIRPAYLYNPSTVRLIPGSTPGTSNQSNQILSGPKLKYNPGLISPTNTAWKSSRKPLVAQWETINSNKQFFTINAHMTSKGGGTGIEADPRPPINGGIGQRIFQSNVTASFVAEILKQDPSAKIITAGDFNEFSFVASIRDFIDISGLSDVDDVAGLEGTERYTYLFDMNCQEIDHVFVSEGISKGKKVEVEHVHVNTWVSALDQASDHDPTVLRVDVC